MASHAVLDDHEAELIKMIYTRIGMVMEDASIIALNLGGPASPLDSEQAQKIRRAAKAITALVDAADALCE